MEPKERFFNPWNIYCNSFDEAVANLKTASKRNAELEIERPDEHPDYCFIVDANGEKVGEAEWKRNNEGVTRYNGTYRLGIMWLI